MDTILTNLCAPSYPAVAGALCATGRYLQIHGIMQYLKKKPKSIRSKCKRDQILSSLKEGICVRRSRNLLQTIINFCKGKEDARNLISKLSRRKLQDKVCETDERWTAEIRDVIAMCNVHEDVNFAFALPFWKQESALKIAEGTYGEIYSLINADGSQTIFKCMPVNDKHPLRESPNLPLKMAVPDIVCSVYLSKLRAGPFYVTPNFPEVYRVCIVKDKFPPALLQSWWRYKEDVTSDHPPPDMYKEGQRFVTIETAFCGDRLLRENVNNAWLGASIMTQLASALAVAESAFNFEHRDLHLGNILLQPTIAQNVYYTIQDLNFSVKTAGTQVTIIDFTLSRIYADSKVHCVTVEEFSQCSTECFSNHKYIYRLMADLFQDDWSKFEPKSNILWLKYVNENIIDFLQKNKIPSVDSSHTSLSVEFSEMTAVELLHKWNDTIMQYNSARHFLERVVLNDNPLVYRSPKIHL